MRWREDYLVLGIKFTYFQDLLSDQRGAESNLLPQSLSDDAADAERVQSLGFLRWLDLEESTSVATLTLKCQSREYL